jgi:pyocin large subunit-like protein
MPNTNGFKPGKARPHWHEHRHKFAIRPANQGAYEMMADAFFGARPPVIAEGERKNGDVIRYDPSSTHFGVINHKREILTFFPAKPGEHPCRTNAEYFIGEIQK